MRILIPIILSALLSLCAQKAGAQQLRLGKQVGNLQKSAILELESDNQGMLLPRINDTALINTLNPPDGMLIFFTPLSRLLIRSNGRWELAAHANTANSFWALGGNNNGISRSFGTNDTYDLPFITSGIERMRILASGNFGVGNTMPAEKLDVTGNVRFSGALMPAGSSGTMGQFLRSTGAGAAPTWITPTLAGLSDVTISSPFSGQVLQYNGSRWVNVFAGYLTSVDTTDISNFHLKVKSLFKAGPGMLYNTATGTFTNTGVTSVNGANGAITLDTGYIANFYMKVRSLFAGSAPITYSNGQIGITQASAVSNGYLSSTDWNNFNNKLNTIDTGNISNFHLKVKSLMKAGTGLSYNAANGTYANTGVLSLNGNTGALTIDTGYIASFSSKVRNLFSAGSGITYNASTGSFSNNLVAGNFWGINGNTGTDAATNFLGTSDDKALVLKSNGTTYLEMGRRATLGLTQSYADYTNNDEQVLHMKSAVQFFAPAAQFYKPKIFVDANGNFRTKGSAAGTDYFEFGSTGTTNDGGFEFIIGDDGDEPIVFKSYNFQTGMKEMMRLQSGNMGLGSDDFNASNPEKLLVDAGVTNSYNLMTGKGSINNYLQINVQNQSSGSLASSDIVATADNGNESVNFIDLGINSSGFTNTGMPIIGGINNAYLYSTGNDFVIGNASASRNLRLFTGGTALTNERLRIDATGNVGIATLAPTAKLDAAGTFKLGAKGSVNKNLFSFDYTSTGAISLPGATIGALASSYTVTNTDVLWTVPTASQPTGTRATVTLTPAFDLPSGIVIASARMISTTQVKVRFINTGTTNQSIPNASLFYFTINEY